MAALRELIAKAGCRVARKGSRVNEGLVLRPLCCFLQCS